MSWGCITRSLPVSAHNRNLIEAQRHASAWAHICLATTHECVLVDSEARRNIPWKASIHTLCLLRSSHLFWVGVAPVATTQHCVTVSAVFLDDFVACRKALAASSALTSLFHNMSASVIKPRLSVPPDPPDLPLNNLHPSTVRQHLSQRSAFTKEFDEAI